MKYFSFFLFSIGWQLCCAQVNPEHHWVDGYFKSDGTYVEGHYRTNPNYTVKDNYSTFPNVNPYTGVQGQKYKYSHAQTKQYNVIHDVPSSYNVEPKYPPNKTTNAPLYWIDASGKKTLITFD